MLDQERAEALDLVVDAILAERPPIDAGVDREHGLVEPEKPVDFVTLFGRLLHSCRVDVGSSPRSSYIPPMMTSIQVVIEDAYAMPIPGMNVTVATKLCAACGAWSRHARIQECGIRPSARTLD